MTNKEIEQCADALWKKYVKQGNAHEYLIQMMTGENIKYKTVNAKNPRFLGAFTQSPKGRMYIFTNSNISNKGRQNFTIAHELGHYALKHPLQRKSFICDTGCIDEGENTGGRLEKEANYFAACLLMPKSKIASAFNAQLRRYKLAEIEKQQFTVARKNYGEWCRIKNKFMKRYGVSEAALRLRLTALNLAMFEFDQEVL